MSQERKRSIVYWIDEVQLMLNALPFEASARQHLAKIVKQAKAEASTPNQEHDRCEFMTNKQHAILYVLGVKVEATTTRHQAASLIAQKLQWVEDW